MCPADSGLTDKVRAKILDVHNELRYVPFIMLLNIIKLTCLYILL